jgi:hypothetical protein
VLEGCSGARSSSSHDLPSPPVDSPPPTLPRRRRRPRRRRCEQSAPCRCEVHKLPDKGPPSPAGGPRSRFGCNDFRQNLGSRRSRLNLILTKILTSKTRARSPGQGGGVSCPRACGQAVDNPCPHSSPASHTLWGHARGCDLRNRTRSAVSCIGTCTIDPGSVAMYERCVGQTHAR